MSYSRTLHLYILRETVKVFILAALAVSLVVNFVAVLIYLQRFPLPLSGLAHVILYRIPALFPWTFPMSLLLAVTLTYGRMATENEIMAMQASGIHMFWVMAPGLLLGAVVTLGLCLVNDQLQPYCERREHQVFEEEAPRVLPMMFRNPQQFQGFLKDLPYEMQWASASGNSLFNVEVTKRDEQNRVVVSYHAERADYRISTETDSITGESFTALTLTQYNGLATSYMKNTSNTIRFDMRKETIPLRGLFRGEPGDKSRTSAQIRQKLEGMKARLSRENAEIDRKLTTGGDPASLEQLRDKKEDNVRTLYRETRKVLIRTHSRYWLATAAFAFVLIGIPLGIFSQRSHMLSAFFLGFFVVLAPFYLLWLGAQALANGLEIGSRTALSLLLGTPTLALGALGTGMTAYLFRR